MRETNKLIIKQFVFSQSTNGNAHATVKFSVRLCLRTVILFKIGNELRGRRGQSQLLGTAAIILPGLQDLLLGGLLLKGNEHRRRMTVGDGHADALGCQ